MYSLSHFCFHCLLFQQHNVCYIMCMLYNLNNRTYTNAKFFYHLSHLVPPLPPSSSLPPTDPWCPMMSPVSGNLSLIDLMLPREKCQAFFSSFHPTYRYLTSSKSLKKSNNSKPKSHYLSRTPYTPVVICTIKHSRKNVHIKLGLHYTCALYTTAQICSCQMQAMTYHGHYCNWST